MQAEAIFLSSIKELLDLALSDLVHLCLQIEFALKHQLTSINFDKNEFDCSIPNIEQKKHNCGMQINKSLNCFSL